MVRTEGTTGEKKNNKKDTNQAIRELLGKMRHTKLHSQDLQREKNI